MNAVVKPAPSLAPFFGRFAALPLFVVWRRVPRDDNRVDKVPVSIETGAAIDAQLADNRMSLADAELWVSLGAGDGVGVVIVPPLFFLDIDHCRNSDNWMPHAAHFVERFPGAYLEVSQGGEGLHVIGSYAGERPTHGTRNRTYRLEIYTGARFCALTGSGATGLIESDHTEALRQLLSQLFREGGESAGAAEWTDTPRADWHGPTDDAELIAKALRSTSARSAFGGRAKFRDLWEANTDVLAATFPSSSGDTWDRSAADQSLANQICFWAGGDCERIARLMRQSALVRPKWDRPDYFKGTILKACADQKEVYRGPNRAQPLQDATDSAVPAPPSEVPSVALAAAVDQTMLADQYTKTKSGLIHGTVRNAFVYLQGIPWMSEVVFDEFSQRIYYQGQEWSPRNETPQLLAVQTSIPAISPDTFARAVEAIALAQRRDRLKDWILTLPQWDGERRLSLWLRQAFGCPTDRYHMRVARNWIISMIARGLDPGCKVDTMPVLEGLQGKRKSMALEALAQPFFLEAAGIKFGDRDFMMSFMGAWLIELPELSALRNADVDSIKATLSRKVDRYRAPYARREADHPRRFVFAGSVNGSDYLRDDTGNRRFLPVECSTVNIAWIRENRDQLFAEALTAYRRRPIWWYFPRVATAEMQDRRLPADPWADLIALWMTNNPEKVQCTSDDLHHAVGMFSERRNRASETRLGRIMLKHFPQWRKTRPYSPGPHRGQRVWVLNVPPPPSE